MTWSHNDMWMLTADHGGYVKYWQSNMNNVKMFQAHKEAIREARSIPNLPFSVVNPRSVCRRRPSGSSSVLVYFSLCCSMFMSLIIDTCTCVLSQHCIDLSPVAHKSCMLDFSLPNHNVPKRLCLFFLSILNKEFTLIFMPRSLNHRLDTARLTGGVGRGVV